MGLSNPSAVVAAALVENQEDDAELLDPQISQEGRAKRKATELCPASLDLLRHLELTQSLPGHETVAPSSGQNLQVWSRTVEEIF